LSLKFNMEKRGKTMNRNRLAVVLGLIASSSLASVVAFGAASDKVEVDGMIMTRTGETLIVSNSSGKTTVVLTSSTVTKDDRGLFGLETEQMSDVVLIPGLKVKVDGVPGENGAVVAKVITVDGDDLESSEMIQAGLHPTAQQVAANVQTLETHKGHIAANKADIAANKTDITANKQDIAAHEQKIAENEKDIQANTDRFTALADYDVKGQATVKFAVGSYKISPADLEQLKTLAQTATGLTGYIIEVTGYADATGAAAMNEKLSENRAKAVIRYLMQQGNVPVRHIVAPGAMGEYGAAAPNETKEGRAENRRVEVKVLVNKGIAGN
jgi:outer membrane protein OmpA-like peptidoglycan-associated protein